MMFSFPLWVSSIILIYGTGSIAATREENEKQQTQLLNDISTIKKIVIGMQARLQTICGNHGNSQSTNNNGDSGNHNGKPLEEGAVVPVHSDVASKGVKPASINQIIEKAKEVAARGGTADIGLMGRDGTPMSHDDPRFKAVVKRLIASGFPPSLLPGL